MADISKITLPNGTTYNLKDSNALTSEIYNAGKQVATGNFYGEIFNSYTLNTASGAYSHAEGYNTTASGSDSHAGGGNTTASGLCSFSEGYGTVAASSYQHAMGKYNVADGNDKYALIIGNGSGTNNKSNAFCVDWNGKIYVNNQETGMDVSNSETVSNGVKNVLQNTLADGTVVSGMTANVDENGIISLSGQNSTSSTKTFNVNLNIPVSEGTYICNGGLSNTVFMTYALYDSTNTVVSAAQSDKTGNGVTFTVPSGTGYYFRAVLQISGSTNVNNKIVKPMIYRKGISDNSFQPYAMSNSELTKLLLNIISKNNLTT